MKSWEQMQSNDDRKKAVGLILWLKFTFKVRQFYRAQCIFGGRHKKACISETIWARDQCRVFLETWERLFSAGSFPKLLGSMVFSQTAFKVGPFFAENSRTLLRIFGQSITVRILLSISPCSIPSQDSKKVWHSILAQTVPKILTF